MRRAHRSGDPSRCPWGYKGPILAGLAVIFVNAFLAPLIAIAATCGCPPLGPPPADHTVVTAVNLSELQAQIGGASGPTTIYLEDGVYRVTPASIVNVDRGDITIRSKSGDRTAVIIEGQGMAAGGSGIGHGIYIAADNVTIADLTVRQTQHHGIFVTPGSDNCSIYNVMVMDTGEQLIKASGGSDQAPKLGGTIACSLIAYTTTLDDGDDGWYTNGIDLLNTKGWTIRDNTLRNIRHHPDLTDQLAGPAILVWQGASDTLIEGNRIIDCDIGIALGNAGGGGVQHTGGIVRNNTIKGYSGSDVGIGLIRATGALVEHNTVYSPGGPWAHSIEARFSETTDCTIRNNFSDEPIWPDRDGAMVVNLANRSDAQASDFRDAAAGDLHLTATAVSAINAVPATGGRTHDLDCEEINDAAADLGADEWRADSGEDPGVSDRPQPAPSPAPSPSPSTGGGNGNGCYIDLVGP